MPTPSALPENFDALVDRAAIAQAAELNAAGQYAAAAAAAQKVLARRPDHVAALYELGMAALLSGRHEAAIIAFRRILRTEPRSVDALASLASALRATRHADAALQAIDAAIALAPGHPSLHHNRGNILMALNRRDDAAASYRQVVALKPGHEGAAYMLKSLGGGKAPDAAPPAFVATMFDQYADRFESHLTETLEYRTPALIAAMLPAAAGDVLDLGCGTGLMASALAGRFAAMDGVDLSPRMIEQCRLKGFYRDLEVGEIGAYLAAAVAAGRKYDLLIAADVFVYVGNLEAVFRGAAGILADDGRFAFSVEHLAYGDFALQQTGRYAHAGAYLNRLSAGAGFAVERIEPAVLRQEGGRPIEGRLMLLRKLRVQLPA